MNAALLTILVIALAVMALVAAYVVVSFLSLD